MKYELQCLSYFSQGTNFSQPRAGNFPQLRTHLAVGVHVRVDAGEILRGAVEAGLRDLGQHGEVHARNAGDRGHLVVRHCKASRIELQKFE